MRMDNKVTVIKQLVKILRLSHWSKAAFVLLGVVYSGAYDHLGLALLAAFCFCLISSAVYIYNDFQDRVEDRLHPYKCHRPLASGELDIGIALSTLVFLLITSLLIAWFISSTLATLLAVYLLINLLYNHLLKQLPVFDVVCIASGFMLRVLGGTIGIGLPVSCWLVLTATLLSLFIALCKRRLEKQLGLKYPARVVLKKYSTHLLDYLITATAFSCLIAYLFYTVYVHKQSFYFLLTLPFAAIGLWRFAWLTTRNNDEDDPISLFFKDNLSRFNLLCFLLLTFVAMFKIN